MVVEVEKFPAWWNKKAIAIAEALIKNDFYLCGNVNDFCIEDDHAKKVCGWSLSYAYQSVGIDAVFEDYLLTKDLHIEGLNPEEEMKKVESIIRNAARKFEHKSKNHKQLKIDFSMCIKWE